MSCVLYTFFFGYIRTKLPNNTIWTPKHECSDGHAFVSPVGKYRANPWGLHDMLGNVWEWTCSSYGKSYDGTETKCSSKNHAGPRSLLGGSWNREPAGVRSASRIWDWPDYRNDTIGFRLAQD